MLCLLLRRTSLAKSSDGGGERSEAKMLHTRFANTVDGFAISEVIGKIIGKIQLIFDGMIKSTMESSDENVKGTARSITKSVTGDIRSGNNKTAISGLRIWNFFTSLAIVLQMLMFLFIREEGNRYNQFYSSFLLYSSY